MLDTILSVIAPHHCSGCGETGSLLCDNCKYDIIQEPYVSCVACGGGIVVRGGLCGSCNLPYERAWCVAPRQDQLEHLINAFKFENTKEAYKPLADLLDAHLPELPVNTRIVPVPTIPSHVRQRGYDHTLLIARRFGKLRQLAVTTSLRRQTSTMQRGASKRQRATQAKQAFACPTRLDSTATYLLLDDVMTTGATMKYAAKALRDAGAQNVWVVSISRQTLD